MGRQREERAAYLRRERALRRLARKLDYDGPYNGRHLPTALGDFILHRWKHDDSRDSYAKVEELMATIGAYPDVAEREIETYLERYDAAYDGLTMDERKTLHFMSHGYQAAEIARFEDVTPEAIKERLRRVRAKLGAVNTTQAVAICIRRGWLW